MLQGRCGADMRWKMGREVKQCKQCGRKIYFDGICISCRAENERQEILDLSLQEVEEKIEYICANIREIGAWKEVYDLCGKLIRYRDIDTCAIAEAAWKERIVRYQDLYKDAPEWVVDEMIQMLMEDSTGSNMAGSLLLCLAAAGGEKVFQTFLALEKQPRKWREKLYVNPSVYATYGGWSYDESGTFRRTNFGTCYPMVKKTAAEREKSPVKIGTRTKETCPRCGCQIVNLMEFDGRDPRLDFLEIPGTVKVKCCPNCFPCEEGAFCRYEIDGGSEIIPSEAGECKNYLGEEGIAELTGNTYVLGDTPVPLRYAADWEGGSSVGGFAFWIQDCEIKLCPDCGKPMMYLAQIQWDTVLDNMEGNAYIEICRDCKLMAVLHQQT